jgi:hypothetical protein
MYYSKVNTVENSIKQVNLGTGNYRYSMKVSFDMRCRDDVSQKITPWMFRPYTFCPEGTTANVTKNSRYIFSGNEKLREQPHGTE